MLKIKSFIFNPLQVNTYLLYNEQGDCLIIDPACMEKREEQELSAFVGENSLKPVMLINTHSHVDHIVGNHFVYKNWELKPQIHQEGGPVMDSAPEQAILMGFPFKEGPKPEKMLAHGEQVELGDERIEIRYTPGHADGSICLLLHNEKKVIAGDVLFAGGIGRADLPTGNMDLLLKSIREQLFTLEDDYVVFPGHGPQTTIGEEKNHNPFFE